VFITLEGPEGAGKSTVVPRLRAALQATQSEVLVTREPGEGEFGKQVRQMLLHSEHMSPEAELFLFLADRAHHVATLIKPALSRGATVICDRYADSTLVYQGYGRGLDVNRVREMNDFATGGLKPDLTILLDLPPEVGLARIAEKDRLDSESLAFHQRVREGFLAEAKLEPNRWVIIDAAAEVGTVLLDTTEAVQRALKTRLS
jgi:dTMP kinase